MQQTLEMAFDYGQITCELFMELRGDHDSRRVSISDAELKDIFSRTEKFVQEKIQDEVAPTLEELVEVHGSHIGSHTPALTMSEHSLFDTTLIARVKCDVMARIRAVEVNNSVAHALLIPLDEYASQLEKEVRRQAEAPRINEQGKDFNTPFGTLLNRVIDTLRGIR